MGSPIAKPVSASQILMVLSRDPEMICRPLGEYLVQLIASACPIQFNGGAGHDDNFPFSISMALVNLVLKVFDKDESEGKKGRVERYVCGALTMMGVRKAMMKRQMS